MGFTYKDGVHRADDEQIWYWQSRDTCLDCGEVIAPEGKTPDGKWRYRCQGDHDDIEWTRDV